MKKMLQADPTDPNQNLQEQLLELAQSDPIVWNYIKLWKQGHCSKEQSLCAIIIELSKQNRLLVQDVLRLQDKIPKTVYTADPSVSSKEESVHHTLMSALTKLTNPDSDRIQK